MENNTVREPVAITELLTIDRIWEKQISVVSEVYQALMDNSKAMVIQMALLRISGSQNKMSRCNCEK